MLLGASKNTRCKVRPDTAAALELLRRARDGQPVLLRAGIDEVIAHFKRMAQQTEDLSLTALKVRDLTDACQLYGPADALRYQVQLLATKAQLTLPPQDAIPQKEAEEGS